MKRPGISRPAPAAGAEKKQTAPEAAKPLAAAPEAKAARPETNSPAGGAEAANAPAESILQAADPTASAQQTGPMPAVQPDAAAQISEPRPASGPAAQPGVNVSNPQAHPGVNVSNPASRPGVNAPAGGALRLFRTLRPGLLDRYLLRQSMWLLLITLGVGGGVYLMTDLFDRMDNFMDAQLELKYILIYFAVKLPFIIAQILPAAFLLSVIIQLCLMAGSRELLALQAGGVSLWRITAFFLMFAVFWGGVQIFLSENLGVIGNNYANRIWNELVQNNPNKYNVVRNFWLMEDNHMIYAQELNVEAGKGSNIVSYTLSGDGMMVERVARAETFSMRGQTWTLHNATIYDTNGFVRENNVAEQLEVRHSRSGLRMLGEDVKLRDYSLWQIGRDIKRLEAGGSNVEVLRTGWHMKIAYAASLIVMALVGVALITWKENIYINIGAGLFITFIFYTILTVAGTLGENGRIPPVIAAWFPVALVGGLAAAKIQRKIPLRFRR